MRKINFFKIPFVLILIVFFTLILQSCITPIKKLDEKKEAFNGKVVRIKCKVTKIYYFKDNRYYIYEIDNKGDKAYLLATKKLNRLEELDFNGRILYVPFKFGSDFEKDLKKQIDEYLFKMTTINEKTIFLHSIRIIEMIKKIAEENKGIVLIFAYNFNWEK